MPAKAQQFIPKGMKRDYSASKADPSFAYENHNIRITAMDGSTLLSITNEKGNKKVTMDPSSFNVLHVRTDYNSTLDQTDVTMTLDRPTQYAVLIQIYWKEASYHTGTILRANSALGTFSQPGKLTVDKVVLWKENTRIGTDGIKISFTEDINNMNIFPGEYVGYCTLDKYLVLFFHIAPESGVNEDNRDYIARLEEVNGKWVCKILYVGDLSLSPENPIEALGVFENINVQKIYWVDGKNQPRIINIMGNYDKVTNSTIFDFAPDLPGEVSIEVKQNQSGSGLFSPGTIQYAVTFYRENGQESGLSAVSPIYYIGFPNRGAAPDEIVGTSFKIEVSFRDAQTFDYARVYSIHRTSKDATPTVKVVGDIPVKVVGDGSLVDTGSVGYNVDPTMLLYLGSTRIKANTIEQKDNTLFLGGYSITETALTNDLKQEIRENSNVYFDYADKEIVPESDTGTYPYKSLLSMGSNEITTFKSREWYRFGIQLQYSSGKWSDVVWIKDVRNTLTPKHVKINGKWVVKLAQGKVTLSSSIVSKLSESFINVRGVVVFPEFGTREVVCQGVINPTVYSVKDRGSNSPFAQASWFFRENTVDNSVSLQGYGVEMRHNHALKCGTSDPDYPQLASMGAEIQSMSHGQAPATPYGTDTPTWKEGRIQQYPGAFYVDQSILTFNSPDIDFDDRTFSQNGSKLKLRLVGIIPITSSTRFATLITKGLGQNGKGALANLRRYSESKQGLDAGVMRPVGATWFDDVAGASNSSEEFLLYPWHRDGSLNNFPTPTGDESRPALWDRKIFSYLRVASYTSYGSIPLWDSDGAVIKDDIEGYAISKNEDSNGITPTQFFDSEDASMIRIQSPENSGLPDLSYYGNVDTVLATFGNPEEDYPPENNSYPIAIFKRDPAIIINGREVHPWPNWIVPIYIKDTYSAIGGGGKYFYGNDPVPMTYKSNKHAVFALNYTNSKQQRILPVVKNNDSSPSNLPEVGAAGEAPFWSTQKIASNLTWVKATIYSKAELLQDDYNYLYLAELYRDTEDGSRFGGNSTDALEANKWMIAGDPVTLGSGSIDVTYSIGDTYYQRYDCLKTYPLSDSSKNNVVDILSFMCETRVNIEGRYDRNRGQLNNTTMSPLNFNLLNPAYTQLNNFFTYNFIDAEDFSIQDFSNSITWTKTKTFGEEVDSWTNLTLASTLDLDGDKGGVEALRKLNNELYCFQPLGISRILYNSRAQMATLNEGAGSLPVELMNTGKVDGKVYITNGVGSSNKWSIVTTPTGMYFIDDLTNSLQLLSANGISDLSDKLAFREWVSSVSSTTRWNPRTFDNVVSFYDSTNSDVYFVTKGWETTVSYSELLGQFTSFFDYQGTPLMFPLNGKFFSLKNHNLWEQNAGEYNSLFGEKRPYSVEVICNMDEPVDKIFNTVEWRATIKENGLDSTKTFSNIRVTTDGEYQDTGDVYISNDVNYPWGGMLNGAVSLRRKFRMWRVPVPRDNSIHGKGRDRMRGPWAKIRLSQDEPEDEKMELHDIIVHFFE